MILLFFFFFVKFFVVFGAYRSVTAPRRKRGVEVEVEV